MAKESSSTAVNPLKFVGAILLFGGSIFLFLHRLPHHDYVAVIEDKPRPKKTEDGYASAAPTPTPAATGKPPAAGPAYVYPTAFHPAPQYSARATETASASHVAPPPDLTVDWTDECSSEIGILCHALPTNRLHACLRGYEDALMRPCRRALDRRWPPKPDSME